MNRTNIEEIAIMKAVLHTVVIPGILAIIAFFVDQQFTIVTPLLYLLFVNAIFFFFRINTVMANYFFFIIGMYLTAVGFLLLNILSAAFA